MYCIWSNYWSFIFTEILHSFLWCRQNLAKAAYTVNWWHEKRWFSTIKLQKLLFMYLLELNQIQPSHYTDFWNLSVLTTNSTHSKHQNKLCLWASKKKKWQITGLCTIIRTHQVTGRGFWQLRWKCDLCGGRGGRVYMLKKYILKMNNHYMALG